MIFYSDEIINSIIDTVELENIVDKIDEFKEDVEMMFTYFTFPVIGLDYIQNLLRFETNKVAFCCMDSVFDIRSCPSCMIYSKQNKKNSDEIVYYIMLICTQKRFKKLGYASMLLDGFVEKVKSENMNSTKKVKIVLSSVDDVVSYYQHYGFDVVDYTLDNYPYLKCFEKYDNTKIYTIMAMDITPASPS